MAGLCPSPPDPLSPQIRIEFDRNGKFTRPNLRGEGELVCPSKFRPFTTIPIEPQQMTRAVISLFVALAMATACGCVKQPTAPELEYSPDEVEQIKEKVDKFDW